MKLYLKELLIFTYFVISGNECILRLTDLGFSLNGAFFAVLFVICLLAIFSASYIKNNYVRLLYALVITISSVIFISYSSITSGFLSYNSFITLLNARGATDDAFFQYYPQILNAILVSSLLFLGISFKVNDSSRLNLPTHIPIWYPFAVILLLSTIFFVRGGDGGKGLPQPFIPLAYASLSAYEAVIGAVGERSDIQITRSNISVTHDIILIVDESISPSYLDINSEYGVKTNLINEWKDIKIFNYGYAAAVTTCSTEANMTLRYGGTRNDYLKIISTMPSIWQYAKSASLNTVYIDGQRTGSSLQNGMTNEELDFVDEFIQFDAVAVVNRDLAVASELIKLINNDSHDFIFVNKVGAHFPVHDKFPDHFLTYKPALLRGDFLDITDTGLRDGFSGNVDDWVLYRNSYRNTILWGVGHFFNELLSKANLNDAIIIYTADHGQDLHEDGRPGVLTHCKPNTVMEEGMVPLVIMQGDTLETLDWAANIKHNHNGSSHYNIFPTLLSLMHYDAKQIQSLYGIPLNVRSNDDLTFNTLFHARLGRTAKWMRIMPDNITIPPEVASGSTARTGSP